MKKSRRKKTPVVRARKSVKKARASRGATRKRSRSPGKMRPRRKARDVGKVRRKKGNTSGAPARTKKKTQARRRLHTRAPKKAGAGSGKPRRRKTTTARRPASKRKKVARSGRVLVHRKPPKSEWAGTFRKYTRACPKKGNFSGVVLIRARFESRPKKVLTVPVGIGYTNRAELKALGREGLEDLIRSLKPTASEVEIIGVVALKPRKERRGIRARKR
jgi:hypothetical protein